MGVAESGLVGHPLEAEALQNGGGAVASEREPQALHEQGVAKL